MLSIDGRLPLFIIVFISVLFSVSNVLAVEIKSPIVVLDPMLSQWLLAFKCVDNVKDLLLLEVGNRGYIEKVFPELKDNIMRKEIDNIESLIALNPRIIFSKQDGGHEISNMEKAGLNVVRFKFENFEDMYAGTEIMGKALAQEKRSQIFIEYFKNTISTLENELKANNKLKPRVYFAFSDIYTAPGKGMYQNFLIEKAGGISVTAQLGTGKMKIGNEELIKFDPEFIILPSYFSDSVELILKNEKLKDLSAVKNKRIFKLPHYLASWDMPVPESILGVKWLINKFHPEFKNDINVQIKEFYSIFYNLKLSDDDVKKIIEEI